MRNTIEPPKAKQVMNNYDKEVFAKKGKDIPPVQETVKRVPDFYKRVK